MQQHLIWNRGVAGSAGVRESEAGPHDRIFALPIRSTRGLQAGTVWARQFWAVQAGPGRSSELVGPIQALVEVWGGRRLVHEASRH